ncbi:hypothetical protein TcWFU_000586 [Taenia crassiceps]|uniref:Uncharacterized protein n=1 Tax=Taenia crassiceps TaxID=6207 RepID=A0ABR4Q8V1_9CEST
MEVIVTGMLERGADEKFMLKRLTSLYDFHQESESIRSHDQAINRLLLVGNLLIRRSYRIGAAGVDGPGEEFVRFYAFSKKYIVVKYATKVRFFFLINFDALNQVDTSNALHLNAFNYTTDDDGMAK